MRDFKLRIPKNSNVQQLLREFGKLGYHYQGVVHQTQEFLYANTSGAISLGFNENNYINSPNQEIDLNDLSGMVIGLMTPYKLLCNTQEKLRECMGYFERLGYHPYHTKYSETWDAIVTTADGIAYPCAYKSERFESSTAERIFPETLRIMAEPGDPMRMGGDFLEPVVS